MRIEHDFLGELEVPDNAYYGVQSLRGSHNFNITGQRFRFYHCTCYGKKSCSYGKFKNSSS